MKTIGERIAFLRNSKGLKQRELMNLLNFNNLSRFERNEMKPGIDTIIQLANFFNVSTDWILTGSEKINDANSHQNILQPEDVELLAKIHQLGDRDRIKIEERIDVLLEIADTAKESYTSKNGKGREEAATKQGA
ncbi:helix-turn-helix domain-containing protein [Paenibacillus sanguinis]|uniref:helix-turn-helix domain-containing protein n=1 Tax=Paenibacillus sanguinis TaxID=225906 RepID=UPI00036B7D8F|nr:helix-turn-helix transcriptional regulator [Paenibacillus sanguinis]